MEAPAATLYIWLRAWLLFVMAANWLIWTTSSIYVKSLEKDPSPFIVGASLLIKDLINLGMAAAYAPEGSCF